MTDKPTYEPHDVDWTPERVSRFWDAQSKLASPESYFSLQAGDDIVRLTARTFPLAGRDVLDYGCGPGFLSEKLAKAGATVTLADFSPASLKAAESRLVAAGSRPAGAVHIRELPSALPASAFDAVFFLETLEHLLPDQLAPTLAELRRVLRPGGILVVTTPNEEILANDHQVCPECGCRFHRMQHVSTWSAASVSQLFEEHGFTPRHVLATTFRPSSTFKRVHEAADRLLRRKPFNLFAIAARRD